jgi:hypothetical protein
MILGGAREELGSAQQIRFHELLDQEKNSILRHTQKISSMTISKSTQT